MTEINNFAQLLAGGASIAIWISTAPQMRYTIKKRTTRDNDFYNLVFCVGGLAIWTTYAAYTEQWIFAIGDGVDMSMWATVLAVKANNIYHKRDTI